MQARSSAVVEIRENTIDGITGADKEAVQITTCKTADIAGNTIRNVAGNVLRVHSLANGVVQQVDVTENIIEKSAYLLWDQTAGAANVAFAENEIASDVDRAHGYDRDTHQPVESAPSLVGDALDITVIWHDGVQAPRAETVKNGWGKPVAKPEAQRAQATPSAAGMPTRRAQRRLTLTPRRRATFLCMQNGRRRQSSPPRPQAMRAVSKTPQNRCIKQEAALCRMNRGPAGKPGLCVWAMRRA